MADRSVDSAPIRVVIADDEPHVAEYLSLVLSVEDGGFEVVGIAADAGAAVDVVAALEPDVLLLDLRMPGGGGVGAAQLVGSMSPGTRVLVFTAEDDAAELLPLLRSGIAGYLTKSATSEEVVAAVRSVAEGRRTFEPHVAARAVDELTDRLHAERSEQLRIEQARRRIERAIRTKAFRIVCQPIVELGGGRTCGVEALARFDGPPARSPLEWFEEADLVDRRIDLELATARAALDLLEDLEPDLWLSVNLSPATVLSGQIDRLLQGVDVGRVVVELTEHAEIEDYGFLNLTLDRLRTQGMRLAVDDAGGGYASFAHVVHARPDFIKLDRSLTGDIDTDHRKLSLVQAMARFAADVGVAIVAEGIEGEAQLGVLRDVGAGFGQGYHLGVPAPLADQPALGRSP